MSLEDASLKGASQRKPSGKKKDDVDSVDEEASVTTEEERQKSCGCRASKVKNRTKTGTAGEGTADFEARVKELQLEQCTCVMREIRGKSKHLSEAVSELEESLRDLRTQHANGVKQCKELLFQKMLYRNMQTCEMRVRLDATHRRLAVVDKQLKCIEDYAEGEAKAK
ncbi:hypothetical protein AAVH_04570 [Aphelenchoides avenae]|nr:hypothetical protein AAVH_04570 [Aphelenchus avenae]